MLMFGVRSLWLMMNRYDDCSCRKESAVTKKMKKTAVLDLGRLTLPLVAHFGRIISALQKDGSQCIKNLGLH